MQHMAQERNVGRAAGVGLRPLSARSVVASVLLGTHPPELAASALVALCARFGIQEGTTRVALSRMVAAGELASAGASYRLVGENLLARQRAQDEARLAPPGPWDGTWRLAVVVGPARPAPERAELRAALIGARYGEWREGVWMRPSNLAVPRGLAAPAGPCRWVSSARPDGDPATLAETLFGLGAWAEGGRRLVRVTAAEAGDLTGDDGRAAEIFTAAAAVLRYLRTDPLLPPELLPPGWPSDELRARYDTYITAIADLVQRLTSGPVGGMD